MLVVGVQLFNICFSNLWFVLTFFPHDFLLQPRACSRSRHVCVHHVPDTLPPCPQPDCAGSRSYVSVICSSLSPHDSGGLTFGHDDRPSLPL